MITILTVLFILVCIFLIISILLQSSKGGGLAGMFGGGGGMGSVFGGRGAASFLAKTSMWLGITFGTLAILIGLFTAKTSSKQQSMIEQVMEKETGSTPAAILPKASGVSESENSGNNEESGN